MKYETGLEVVRRAESALIGKHIEHPVKRVRTTPLPPA